MGDRANVKIKDRNRAVWLYTHWSGTELPQTVQTALKRQQRWNDPAYLTRIIFDTMTEGDQGAETGFGISAFVGDGEDRVITVDCGKQAVSINGRDYSFEEFIALKHPEWPEGGA